MSALRLAAAAVAALVFATVNAEAAPWRVDVTTHGGLSGRGSGGVKIRSSGDVEVVTATGQRCDIRLGRAALAKVEQALRRARPERWRPRYFMRDNPTGCCDQVSTTLAIVQGEAEKQSVTGWYDESRQLVPRDARAVHEAAMGLALVDQGCAAKGQ